MTPLRSNISRLVEVSDVDDDNDDDDDNNDDDDDDSDDIDDMSFRLFVPPKKPVNEAVITPAETKTKIDIFRQPDIPTPEQMDALIKEIHSTARKPPQVVSITVESPFDIDNDEPNASMVHQDVQSPNFDDNFNFVANEETFAPGSSSAPSPPEHDVASIKLAKILSFQDSIPQCRGKSIYWLRTRRLSTFYFDFKDKLFRKFVDEFKTSSSDDGKCHTPKPRMAETSVGGELHVQYHNNEYNSAQSVEKLNDTSHPRPAGLAVACSSCVGLSETLVITTRNFNLYSRSTKKNVSQFTLTIGYELTLSDLLGWMMEKRSFLVKDTWEMLEALKVL
uniref:Uncharacterized protein n=1 Tax=Lactuca sativa TaxID=4236 RepID=A0A9R1XSM0_LACSA|nr:hypothetical protein LSAT_V11C200061700 [Lactuca sativa]